MSIKLTQGRKLQRTLRKINKNNLYLERHQLLNLDLNSCKKQNLKSPLQSNKSRRKLIRFAQTTLTNDVPTVAATTKRNNANKMNKHLPKQLNELITDTNPFESSSHTRVSKEMKF